MIKLFCTCILFALGFADPYFSSLLYQSVPHQFCSRFYYRNGGIGCRTSLSGVSGALVSTSSVDDIQDISEQNEDGVILLVNSTNLTYDLIHTAMETEAVVGMAIYGKVKPETEYSPFCKAHEGKGTPTESLALHSEYEWNPSGTGLFYRDFKKPIVWVTDDQTIPILLQKATYNTDSSTVNSYLMDIHLYMGPDEMDSPTCLSKGACIPMGGQSVWSIAGERDTRPIVLIATAMDSVSEFYDQGQDGFNAGVRLSVLLAIASALQSISLEMASKQLMVAFFEGESWGRVGSRLFIADLNEFKCNAVVKHASSPFNDRMCTSPIRLSLVFESIELADVERVIVLDQLLPAGEQLFFHTEQEFQLPSFESKMNIQPATQSLIPPGTGESFYQAGVRNTVVITGYDTAFANSHLGSVFQEAIDEEKVGLIADSVFDFLLTSLGVEGKGEVDKDYLNSLLQCLSIDGNCTVIESLMGYQAGGITNQLNHKPLNKFAGTYHAGKYPLLMVGSSYKVNYTSPLDPSNSGVYFTPSVLESFIQASLSTVFYSNRTDASCTAWKDCRSFENGYCIRGKCIASRAYFHDAVDVGVELIGVDRFQVKKNIQNTPIYTEPYWGGYYGSEPSVTVYQKTSMVTEWMVFVSGVLLTVIAWVATRYFFSYYATQLKLGKYTCLFNKHAKTKVVQERIHLYLPYSQTEATMWNNHISYNLHSTYHSSFQSKPFPSPMFGFVYRNSTFSPPTHARFSLAARQTVHSCTQTITCSRPCSQSPLHPTEPPLALVGSTLELSEGWQVSI